MPDPSWPSSPPEVNHLRLAGPGAAGTATTLASGAAWQAVMGATTAAASASALNTVTTAADFNGVGGASSAVSATGLNTALQLLAGWAQEKPPITASAVSAYETAVSTMIPAEVALANRAEQAADVAINPLVFGALTPAIVALDMIYFGEFWPHNASTGAAYGTALAALAGALAVPPPLSPPGGSAAAPTTAATALAQAAGQTAGAALSESAQVAGDAALPVESTGRVAVSATSSLASAAAQPLQGALEAQPPTGMFGPPIQALGGIGGFPAATPPGPGRLPDPQTAVPIAAGSPAPGSAPGIGRGGPVSAAVGPPNVGGPLAGGGLTSYARPGGGSASENSGRPVGLRTGLLSAGSTGVAGLGGTAIPVAPAQTGMLGRSRTPDDTPDSRTQARIVIGSRPVS